MTRIFWISSLTILLIFPACQSPTDKLNSEFEAVNSSLEKSQLPTSKSLDSLYNIIQTSNQVNERFKQKADSVYLKVVNTTKFIDTLKRILRTSDSVGSNINTASTLLVSTRADEKLREDLIELYITITSFKIDSLKQIELQKNLSSLRGFCEDPNWSKKHFEKASTSAAISMLNNFVAEYTNAARIIMSDANSTAEE